jgi:hypothetical protein
VGWAEEWAALQTVKASLQAMKENVGCRMKDVQCGRSVPGHFLRKNQVSSFLLWADHNAEAMMNSIRSNAANGVPAGPVFGFGVEKCRWLMGKINTHNKRQ